jgi:DNA topoisomerase-1
MAVYMEEKSEDEAPSEEDEALLPPLTEGDTLKLIKLDPKQHFTQPPPRFSEALLVKTLEEKGIGRPSTYAAIISTIQERDYVSKVENKFRPSELGVLVNKLLVENFPEVLDVAFTARMEEELDKVEEDMLNLDGMDKSLAAKLARNGVCTRDDLADLAVDELTEMTGIDEERAKALITTARAHWFADEQQ